MRHWLSILKDPGLMQAAYCRLVLTMPILIGLLVVDEHATAGKDGLVHTCTLNKQYRTICRG